MTPLFTAISMPAFVCESGGTRELVGISANGKLALIHVCYVEHTLVFMLKIGILHLIFRYCSLALFPRCHLPAQNVTRSVLARWFFSFQFHFHYMYANRMTTIIVMTMLNYCCCRCNSFLLFGVFSLSSGTYCDMRTLSCCWILLTINHMRSDPKIEREREEIGIFVLNAI